MAETPAVVPLHADFVWQQDDQPTTCPECGRRTVWEGVMRRPVVQVHTCPCCGFRFAGVWTDAGASWVHRNRDTDRFTEACGKVDAAARR